MAAEVHSRAERAPCAHLPRPALLLLVMLSALCASSFRALPSCAEDGWLDRKKLTGDWNGVRPALSEHGFSPYLTYTGVMNSNLAGGIETGTEFDGYLDFGLDVDLARLGAWGGSGLHVDWHWYQGRQPTEVLVGGLVSMSVGEWEASNAFRFYNIYFHQWLDGDSGSDASGGDDGGGRWQLKVGQIATDSDFMISRYAGLFLNGAFGDLPSENENTNTPTYPLAAPGVFVGGKIAPWLATRLAVYTGDAGQDVSGNHGFDWKLGNDAGYGAYAELTLEASPGGLPTNLTGGGYYVAKSLAEVDGEGARYGNYSLYLMLDQALIVDDPSQPFLAGFARFSVSPQQDRNPVFLYADAGLNVFGPIRSRPADVAGLAFGIVRLTDGFRNGGGTTLPAGEALVEATYQAAVTPWLTLPPDFPVIVDPPFAKSDAYVVGMQAVALF